MGDLGFVATWSEEQTAWNPKACSCWRLKEGSLEEDCALSFNIFDNSRQLVQNHTALLQ